MNCRAASHCAAAWHEIEGDSENEYEDILPKIDLGLAELTKSSEVGFPDLKAVL
jgi:hypothetical protein